MRVLNTIQKHNNLNQVYAVDQLGAGGANHQYTIASQNDTLLSVQFQHGPRLEADSTPGVLDVDLLEIVRDRLKSFQSGDFACRENACALTHLEEALMWMNKRVEDRAARGVLGTNNK